MLRRYDDIATVEQFWLPTPTGGRRPASREEFWAATTPSRRLFYDRQCSPYATIYRNGEEFAADVAAVRGEWARANAEWTWVQIHGDDRMRISTHAFELWVTRDQRTRRTFDVCAECLATDPWLHRLPFPADDTAKYAEYIGDNSAAPGATCEHPAHDGCD